MVLVARKTSSENPVTADDPPPRKRTTVTIPVELHKEAKRRAIDDECDLSAVVVEALKAYLQ